MTKEAFAWSMILALLVALVGVPATAQEPQLALQPQALNRLSRLPQIPALPGEVKVDPAQLPQGARAALGLGGEAYFMVELEAEPLAVLYARGRDSGLAAMSAASQREYAEGLKAAQAKLLPEIRAMRGVVISTYQKVYNGIQVRISIDRLIGLSKLPGVKAVHRMPLHTPLRETSLPWIGVDQVRQELGLDGTGVTIAIIDTGLDYYHEDLGGSGDPADFAADDNTIVEEYTFPTPKVIGGYDFAGPYFDPSSDDPEENVPQPDPDPLDGYGHGTPMAGIAAGLGVEGEEPIGEGVAPGALLYAVKIFRDYGAASTTMTMDGVEWSMDPNQDGDISDHVDVMNLSLGGAFNPPDIPSSVACTNAALAGVVVVASAGNAGDVMYIHDAPGNADKVISVAASVDNDADDNAETKVQVTSPFAALYEAQEGTDSKPLLETGDVLGEIVLVGRGCVDTTEDTYEADPAGKVALIRRGDCPFQEKVAGVEAAGALAAIVYNNLGDVLTNMAVSSGIPAVFIGQSGGDELAAAASAGIVEGGLSRIPKPEMTNTIPDFSSRGPRGPDSALKPDIAAPGFRIHSAAVGAGAGAEKGSGTSPAAPHVAGVAALLLQQHPDWTVDEIKAAIMNTATDLATVEGEKYPLSRQGAGLLNATAATAVEALAMTDSGNLSFGVVPVDGDTSLQRTIKLVNKGAEAKTFGLEWSFQFPAEDADQGVSITLPPSVTVEAGSFVNVPVQLDIDVEMLPQETYDFGGWAVPEYDGFITFSEQPVMTDTVTTTVRLAADEMLDTLRVPFHIIPRPTSKTRGPSSVDVADWTVPYTVFELANPGPIASSVYLLPGYGTDPNEVDVEDNADIRYVGVDAFQPFTTTVTMADTVILFGISVYDSYHTPQPYWNEFDIYIDHDQDGEADYVVFNWNYGVLTTGDDNDVFVPVIVDLHTGGISVPTYPSPYDDYVLTNYAEFNAATMEMMVKGTDIGLSETDTGFDFMIVGYDAWGNSDVTTVRHADAAHPPLGFVWAPPAQEVPAQGSNLAGVTVSTGYLYNSPTDILAFYYNDAPGLDQAQYIPLNVEGWHIVYLMNVWKTTD